MRNLKILMLVHHQLVPPEKPPAADVVHAIWRTEYDVAQAIVGLGHELKIVGVEGELKVIREVVEYWKPHLVFNLLEEFDGIAVYDQNVVSYLELLKLPYTGCNPQGLILSRNKALAKKILAFHRIPVPKFVTYPIGKKRIGLPKFGFPMIVKSLTEEASLGISQASVVYTHEKLRERVRFVHQAVETDAMVEQFIEGRELYVGVLGNFRIQLFPIWELKFSEPDSLQHNIATAKVKWDPKYQKKHNITSGKAEALGSELETKIFSLCKRTYQVLGLSGYARIDLRLDARGIPFILEANPNPDISRQEDFSQAAKVGGLKYEELISKIISLGLSWRSAGSNGS
jgi:D-alanine-D-alanine ligase